jgi:hypothetical protein
MAKDSKTALIQHSEDSPFKPSRLQTHSMYINLICALCVERLHNKVMEGSLNYRLKVPAAANRRVKTLTLIDL